MYHTAFINAKRFFRFLVGFALLSDTPYITDTGAEMHINLFTQLSNHISGIFNDGNTFFVRQFLSFMRNKDGNRTGHNWTDDTGREKLFDNFPES